MIIFFNFILTFYLIFHIKYIQSTDLSNCGDIKYVTNHGICKFTKNNEPFVECKKEYTTYPENYNEKCNYKRKRQIKAFLLELFVTYGSGHFYTENYKYAIPKLIVFVGLYCLFIALRIVSKAKEENKKANLAISISAAVCFIGMLIWQLLDVIKYGINSYKDGNGVELLSMN